MKNEKNYIVYEDVEQIFKERNITFNEFPYKTYEEFLASGESFLEMVHNLIKYYKEDKEKGEFVYDYITIDSEQVFCITRTMFELYYQIQMNTNILREVSDEALYELDFIPSKIIFKTFSQETTKEFEEFVYKMNRLSQQEVFDAFFKEELKTEGDMFNRIFYYYSLPQEKRFYLLKEAVEYRQHEFKSLFVFTEEKRYDVAIFIYTKISMFNSDLYRDHPEEFPEVDLFKGIRVDVNDRKAFKKAFMEGMERVYKNRGIYHAKRMKSIQEFRRPV